MWAASSAESCPRAGKLSAAPRLRRRSGCQRFPVSDHCAIRAPSAKTMDSRPATPSQRPRMRENAPVWGKTRSAGLPSGRLAAIVAVAVTNAAEIRPSHLGWRRHTTRLTAAPIEPFRAISPQAACGASATSLRSCAWTVRTGHGAVRTILSVTLPIIRRETAPRPAVAMTIRSIAP